MENSKFYESGIGKRIFIDVAGTIYSNEHIVYGSTELSDTINSDDDLVFGSAESAQLKFKIFSGTITRDSFKGKRFHVYRMYETNRTDLYYLVPRYFVTHTAEEFDSYQFTAGRFDKLGFTVKEFDDTGRPFENFSSLLVNATNLADPDFYFVINSVSPYIELYHYDGVKMTKGAEMSQPTLPIHHAEWRGNKLELFHLGSTVVEVYTIGTDGTVTRETDRQMTESERLTEANKKENIYWGDTPTYFLGYIASGYGDSEDVGYFNVDEITKINDGVYSVLAFDDMVKTDADVSDWFNELQFPMTVKQLAEALCQHLGIEYEFGTFLNSDMTVNDMVTLEGVTGREILSWIGEVSGTFPHMRKDGKMILITLNMTSAFTVPFYDSGNLDVAEYTVSKIEKLQVRSEETDVGIIVGDGTNAYIIEGNPLFYFDSDAQGRPYVEKLFNAIKDITYIPYSFDSWGNPNIGIGTTISVTTRTETLNALVMNRTLIGERTLKDSYSASGNPDREDLGIVNKTIIRTGGKINRLEITLEHTMNELVDFENQTSSKFEQTAEQISTLVTADENLQSQITQTASEIRTEIANGDNGLQSQITQQAGQITTLIQTDTGLQSQIDQQADQIALKVSSDEVEQMISVELQGVVFKNNLTDGTTVISGNNIKTGTINAININSSTITGGTINGTEINWGSSGSLYGENQYLYIDGGSSGVILDTTSSGSFMVMTRMAVDHNFGVTGTTDLTGEVTMGDNCYIAGYLETGADIYAGGELHMGSNNISFSSRGEMWMNGASIYMGGGNIYDAGNLSALSAVSMMNLETYSAESTSPILSEIGEGVIEDGECIISLSNSMKVNGDSQMYQVFLQAYGEGNVYVSERQSGYFIVKGTEGLSFGYEVKIRKGE